VSGITPNPRTDKVYEGIKICKEQKIDFILAMGGGSTIDCTKAISVGSKTDEDFWEKFYIKGEKATSATPFGSILTIAATGSEMNMGSVVTNWEKQQKYSYQNPFCYPKFSILDPIYTFTLPKEQLVYGCVDMLSHLMETYFSYPDEDCLSDDIAETIFKNVMRNLAIALKNPQDYNARANIMWDGTMALNGITRLGKKQDWTSHGLEHALSALYDIPHGAGLAIVHPNYLKYIYKEGAKKLARFARNIWDIAPAGKSEETLALEGVARLQQYFKEIGAPTTFGEVNIPATAISKITDIVVFRTGCYHKMTKADAKAIYELCV
jgi:alcohol dehydrogenase YqhD (iron-dependent ADH family)